MGKAAFITKNKIFTKYSNLLFCHATTLVRKYTHNSITDIKVRNCKSCQQYR